MKLNKDKLVIILAIAVIVLSTYVILEALGVIIGPRTIVRRIDLNAPEYSISISPKLTLEYGSPGLAVIVSVSNTRGQEITIDEIKDVKVCIDTQCSESNFEIAANLPIKVKPGETVSFPLIIDIQGVYNRIQRSIASFASLNITLDIMINGYDNIVYINYGLPYIGRVMSITGEQLWIGKVELFTVNKGNGAYELYMNIYAINIGTGRLYLDQLEITPMAFAISLNKTSIPPLGFWSYTFKLGTYNESEISELKNVLIKEITIQYSLHNAPPKVAYYEVKAGDWRK